MNRSESVSTIEAQYLCSFRPEPEGGYTVRCAAFPEIVTYDAASLQEARSRAQEAIELCLEVYQNEGRPTPPSDAARGETIEEVIPVRMAPI
jgi:predicted RNase H-like HicB family nuclease